MTPASNPQAYKSIVLDGKASPGVVTLSGHDRNQAWDKQKAKGQTGATSVHNGEEIGEFQASFFLPDVESQLAWPAFQRVIESSTSGGEPKALSIYHPDLALNRYTEVCNAGVGGKLRDSQGGETVLVKFIEYRPPKPKPAATATATTGASETEKRYDPNREAKRELQSLLDEAAEA